jgi:tetratricopeptide (TPR) repeat protein
MGQANCGDLIGMVRLEIIFAFAVCFSQICCGRTDSPLGQTGLQNRQDVSGSPLPQQGNQTDPRKLSGEEHWVRGNILRDQAEYEGAVREYKLAIANGYDTNELRTEMGRILARQLHHHEEAIEQFRIAIQRDEKDWRAHWSLAQSLLETKLYDEALRELEIAKRLDPANTSRGFYTYYTAKALDGLGRYDEALKDYQAFLERAKKVEPNSPRVREVRARVEEIKGTKK